MLRRIVGCTALAAGCAAAQVTIQGVLSAVSFHAQLSPGAPAAIFGAGLAPRISQASGIPLPTELAGTSVQVAGIRAPLYYVSPGQVNFQMPFEAAPGNVTVTVVTAQGTSTPYPVKLDAVAPAIFSRNGDGLSPPLLISSDFQLLDFVTPGQNVVLYAAGLGPTDPPWFSGQVGTVRPLQHTVLPVIVGVGDTGALVGFAGAAPGFAGVYQLNITVPPHPASDVLAVGVSRGDSEVYGASRIPIRNPAVVHATGSIEILFPPDGYAATVLPLPMVARYSVDVDTKPGAGDYLLSLSCGAGDNRILVSPDSGSYTVGMNVPIFAARRGDFSAGDLPARDLLQPGAPPFPNNIVPASRLDPAALAPLNLVPAPNGAAIAGSSFAQYQGQGTFAAGTHFHLDGTFSPDPTITAGFIDPLNLVPAASERDSCSLFLDGMLLDQKSVVIRWP